MASENMNPIPEHLENPSRPVLAVITDGDFTVMCVEEEVIATWRTDCMAYITDWEIDAMGRRILKAGTVTLRPFTAYGDWMKDVEAAIQEEFPIPESDSDNHKAFGNES